MPIERPDIKVEEIWYLRYIQLDTYSCSAEGNRTASGKTSCCNKLLNIVFEPEVQLSILDLTDVQYQTPALFFIIVFVLILIYYLSPNALNMVYLFLST